MIASSWAILYCAAQAGEWVAGEALGGLMSNETYNGWANVETWAFALHVNNDEGLQNQANELTAQAIADSDGDIEAAAYVLAESLKDWAESLLTPTGYAFTFGDVWPAGLAEVATDIGSLWRVDWAEVAAAFVADMVPAVIA